MNEHRTILHMYSSCICNIMNDRIRIYDAPCTKVCTLMSLVIVTFSFSHLRYSLRYRLMERLQCFHIQIVNFMGIFFLLFIVTIIVRCANWTEPKTYSSHQFLWWSFWKWNTTNWMFLELVCSNFDCWNAKLNVCRSFVSFALVTFTIIMRYRCNLSI